MILEKSVKENKCFKTIKIHRKINKKQIAEPQKTPYAIPVICSYISRKSLKKRISGFFYAKIPHT